MSAVVYRMFDASGQLLYVGSTSHGANRIDQHHTKAWFRDVAFVAVEHHDDANAARVAEAAAITAEQPAYNVHHRAKPVRQQLKRGRKPGLRMRGDVFSELLATNRSDFAEAVGMSRSHLSEIASGKKGASPRQADAIARRLGVNVADLFDAITEDAAA